MNRFDSNPSWHIDAGAGAVHPITVILYDRRRDEMSLDEVERVVT